MDDKIEAWANEIIREVAELPDRNSPEGQPEMMLVSADELRSIMVRTTPEGYRLVPVEQSDDTKRIDFMHTALLRDASMRFDDGSFKAVNAWSIASSGKDLRAAVDAMLAASQESGK